MFELIPIGADNDRITADGQIHFDAVTAGDFQDVSPSSQMGELVIDLQQFVGASYDLLVELLTDSNNILREIAAQQLGRLGDNRAVKLLIEAFDEGQYGVQEKIILSLGALGGPLAIGRLTKLLLEEKYKWVSYSTVVAIVGANDAKIHHFLREFFVMKPASRWITIIFLPAMRHFMKEGCQ